MSDILIFFPGSLDIIHKKEKSIKILNNIISNNYTNAYFIGNYETNIFETFKDFKIDNHLSSCSKNKEINNESQILKCRLRPYGEWYRYFFRDIEVKCYTYNGIFSIDKRDVIQHLKIKYIMLLNSVSNSFNPEAGHYIERSWCAIFYPMIYTEKIIF